MWPILLIFSLLVAPLSALYYGNPHSPDFPEDGVLQTKENCTVFSVDYEWDWVSDRKMETENSGLHFTVDRFHSSLNAGSVMVSFINRLQIYGLAGGMSFDVTERTTSDSNLQMQTSTHFAWGVGGRAILLKCKNIALDAAFGYLRCDAPFQSLSSNGATLLPVQGKLDYREWQVGLGLSYKIIEEVLPYIALTYSDAKAKLMNVVALASFSPIQMESRENVGLVLGCSITPGRSVALGVEAQLISEEGITLSGTLKF